MCARNVEIVSSWKLDSSSTFHCPARDVSHHRSRWSADIAAHLHRNAAGLQNMSGHRRRRGLSVRTGDADDLALQKPAREFQIADHRDAAPAGLLREIQVGRHARREHHQIRSLERSGFLRLDGHAQLDKFRICHCGLIHCRHSRSLFHQQLHRRDAAARHSDHDCSRTFHTLHRSFSVVSANNASSRPAIQKRMITLDSAHPNCSK